MRIVFWQIEAPPPEKKNPKQYTEISLYKNQTVSHGWKQGVIISPILGCTKNMWIYFFFFLLLSSKPLFGRSYVTLGMSAQ